jgi:hypothetical protein
VPEDLILLQSSVDLLAAARRQQEIGWNAFGPAGTACTSGDADGIGEQNTLCCLDLRRVADASQSIRQTNRKALDRDLIRINSIKKINIALTFSRPPRSFALF